ncbi:PspA/IM30 family protein [Candidatus Poribacteria bacterium]|nr:PspA/IM30 family protein [Candidatus Poribacteria bacterium]
MGILDRAKRIFKANINAALSKAEDPEKMLAQIVSDMQEQIIKVRQQVAAAIADQKKLEKQWRQYEEEAKTWQERAKLALQKGNEELARQALERKNQARELADEFKIQLDKQATAVQQLKESLRDLEMKVEQARRKKNLLIARQKRAEAQKRIHDTIAGMKEGSAFEAFERMSQKVDEIEAQAEAAEELAAEREDKDLEKKFRELTASSVDEELEKLKAELQGGKPADPVEAELQELKSEVEKG